MGDDDLKIGAIGYNHTHDADYYQDRPQGIGCWLFLHIRTPAIFRFGNREYNVKKGSAVLISPWTSCYYRGAAGGYADDWIFFNMTDDEYKNLMDMGISADKPIYLGAARDLSSIIHRITFEHYSAEPLHSEIEHKYFEVLFLRLARAFRMDYAEDLDAINDKNSAMVDLRASIYSDPTAFGSVKSIAENMHMSCSGLQHLYKRLFGVNISSDIINSRLARAKDLLSSTGLTVDRVAEHCGYSCTYSFLRQFKEKCGCTPTQFRKKPLPDGELWSKLYGSDT